MASKPNLRTVKPGERPAKKAAPKTLVQAANDGDYRELLVAQRADIAMSLQNPETQGPARAALHRQLGLIARELRDMDAAAAEEDAENASAPDQAWTGTF